MKSNATLITFLTISESSEEKIFFGYMKELEEIAPPIPYWYKGKGKNGHAGYLWEEKKLKQWTMIANDEYAKSLFENLNANFELNIKLGLASIKFTIPEMEKKIEKENIYAIPGVNMCERSETSVDYICKSWHSDISFLLSEENNCEFISGYKYINTIKPIEPYGLFSEKFLSHKLDKKICFVHDIRGIFYSLSEVRKETKDDPAQYVGFIQMDSDFKENTKVIIRDINGDKVLGESDISKINGRWSMNLSEPASRGEFLFADKTSGEFLCGEKFYLIKNISINSQIVSSTIKDLFDREVHVVSNERRLAPLTDSIVWHSSSAPSDRQGEIELSDRLSQILLSLGKNIIISDPYFLGEIKIEGAQLKLSRSQVVFMNALIISLAKGGIEELNIIGSWRKISQYIDGDQTQFVESYQAIYKALHATFTNSSLLKLKSFNICFSKLPFHDRYILNGADEEIVYNISNSINGILPNSELIVMPLTTIDIFKVRPKILQRFDESEKHNLIS